jgi:hypothetical protein
MYLKKRKNAIKTFVKRFLVNFQKKFELNKSVFSPLEKII